MDEFPKTTLTPPRKFLRMCRRNRGRRKLADSYDMIMTGGKLLLSSLIFRRLLRREVLQADEKCVGVLLPPSTAGSLVNATLALDGRVVVNLNYTVSSAVLNDCLAQAGIRHVITSRRVIERLRERGPLEIDCELVYLEDLRKRITLVDKAVAAFQAHLLPIPLLERWLGLTSVDPEETLAIIFTSGATGRPKGVMLSHRNVDAEVVSFSSVIRLTDKDVMVGILPTFHVFGYAVTLWAPLVLDPMGLYHYSPLEPREIGKLCRRYGGTLLLATPTFLRSYLRRVEPEDFATLDTVVVGAEKMPIELIDAFEARFGCRPVEGYGATETTAGVMVNCPANRRVTDAFAGLKEGTVGKPLPGAKAKVVDIDTGKELGPNRQGMLWIGGPHVMKGYLNRPDLTADALRDGWYVTGDMAEIDEEGFVTITGRLARFSKIGGEMVPHIRIEEAIIAAAAIDPDEVRVAVSAVPDAKKGERIVVLYTELPKTPEEICRILRSSGLPPIWQPAPDSFCKVDAIPVLGTGKLDLKQVKELAGKVCGPIGPERVQ